MTRVTLADPRANLLSIFSVSSYMRDHETDEGDICTVRRVMDQGTAIGRAEVNRSKLVVADSGDHVELLVLSSGEPVGRGVRFEHQGTWWVVSGRRRDSGVAVAEPAGH